jgi:hypothetical protein
LLGGVQRLQIRWKKPEKMFSGGKGGRGPPIVVHK